MGIIKLFELELTALQTSKELNLNKTTVQRIYNKIREAIVGEQKRSNNTNALTDVIKTNTPDFSISIIDGVVNILIDKTSNTNVFSMKRSRVPGKETSYGFSYTNVKPSEIEKCLNQLPLEQNYFWRYARLRLYNYRGTNTEYLYHYLKEIEFRYNNREGNIFKIIVSKIAHFEGWR